tara:strand:- start:168 stop:1913 length:1746 start_codon:yes stop_codon:yes gene_type:complete
VVLEVQVKNNLLKLFMRIPLLVGFTFYTLVLIFNTKAQKKESFDERLFSKYLIQATGSKISGDLYTADSIYKKCLEINPYSGVVNFELSGIYRSLKQPLIALEYAHKAVNINNENEWYLANLAILYKEIGNHKKSVESFSKLTELKPEKITYLFSLTEELLANKKYKKAIEILNKIENNIGINEDLSIQKHQIYVYLRNKKKAIIELDNLIKEDSTNLRIMGLLAEYYENINQPFEAKNLLDNMMKIDSSNGLVRLSLFQHYYKKRKFLNGYSELLHVMKSKEVEENLKKQMLLQIFYDKNSPYSLFETSSLIHNFLEEHPNNSDVLLIMGNLKMMQGKEDTACYYLRESLKINSLPIDAWIQLISSTISRGKFDIAIKDSEAAIESHPNQPFPYLAMGISLSNNELLDKSLKFLHSGRELVISDSILESDFLHEIGNVYYKQNKYEKCFDYYEMSIALNPKNLILLNNYSYYLALRKTNLQRAEELILIVLSKFPNIATYCDTYGWVLFQMGKYSLSEKELFKAVMYSNESSGEILEHYGDALFKLNKKDGALLFWKKAKENGGNSKKLIQKISENRFIE